MEETREKEEILDRAELERIDDEGIGSWDRHDPDGFAALSPTPSRWSDWNVPEPIRDEEGFRRYVQAWFTAFPDITMNRTERLIHGNSVAGEMQFTGTNSGPLAMGGMEMPPDEQDGPGPAERSSPAATTRARSWSSELTPRRCGHDDAARHDADVSSATPARPLLAGVESPELLG